MRSPCLPRAKTCPHFFFLVKIVEVYRTLPCRTLTLYPTLADPILVLPYPTLPYPTMPLSLPLTPTLSYPILPYRAGKTGVPSSLASLANSRFSRSTRERDLMLQVGPEGGSAPPEALNEKAVKVIRRVQDKLAGLDFANDEPYDVDKQVDLLIKQVPMFSNSQGRVGGGGRREILRCVRCCARGFVTLKLLCCLRAVHSYRS